jgi:23S rRNA (uracil1939-C5)-methyltransferase
MKKKNTPLPVLENVEIIDAASEGVAIARIDGKVLFVKNAVPGDIANVQVIKKRSAFLEGIAKEIITYSEKRAEPFCTHFGVCGGCKWQNMKYEHQLFYKQKQVADNLERIGKIDVSDILPIIPSKHTQYYRNKLEYTFSDRRWLTNEDMLQDDEYRNMNALGFHIPGFFDKVLDIEKCFLQPEPSNAIRLKVKKYCIENGLTFFNLKQQHGLLRNLIIRNTSTNELMVIFSFYEESDKIHSLLDHIIKAFPEITSLMYVINGKKNDVISDLEIQCYKGNSFIYEEMEGMKFKVGPVSFFQTNTEQAYELYKTARTFAGLSGDELVYDLYTGTGTIANFIASKTKKVIGIEYIESAVDDAKENAKTNQIENTFFYAGDLAEVLNDDFIALHGKPDVIITDPPRAGMHKNVVTQILKIAPEKIVYISCNPATQARDIEMIRSNYSVTKIQPVDMFPHTHHVENIVLMEKHPVNN